MDRTRLQGRGREARIARRRDQTGSDAVWPGLKGGAYKPLSQRDMERIHETALDVLEKIGMGEPIPSTRERALAAGCWMSEAGRLCFPRALVEDVIAGAARRIRFNARDPQFDRELGGEAVFFATAGEAVRMIDLESGQHRPTTIADVYDLYRLADTLEHIHHVGQPIIACDIEDPLAHDLSIGFAAVNGTRKSFGMSTANPAHVDKLVEMFDCVLEEEGAFLKRPFMTVGHCPIVSPLRFGQDTSAVAVRCAELGLTSDMCVAPQAGATAPAALAGALVQAVAETLAALVQVNLVRKGAPMMFGNWVFVSDLRTGAFSGGGGEEALLMAAAAQLVRFYDLPGSVAAGMTDSKTLDYQAGFEKGVTEALAAMAGGNMIYESAGMMSSLLATSFEGMVMDNEMIGFIQRALRGVEVTDDTLSFQVMEDVVLRGPGHYLGHAQTLSLMTSEYIYPEIANRMPLSEWEQVGSPAMVDAARKRVREVLANHYPAYVSAEAQADIRRRFPIRLPPAAMGPRA
jgi:trimethylamine--corrinoid protein Co-methyltransferase